MKKKMPEIIKDGLVGVGIGCATIVPGISAGTITIITKTFKKIVNAVDGLFSKNFFRSLLTLLPFGIMGVLTVALLIKPINLALTACMFAIMVLFAGFIAGSLPGVTDEVRGEKINKFNLCFLLIGLFLSISVGLCSLFGNFSMQITNLFDESPWFLYLILFAVGIIGSTGLIVPGLSGSAILLVLGFYSPILSIGEKVISFGSDFGINFLKLAVFALGVLTGFVFFSKLMNKMLTNHKRNSYFLIIGLIVGSLVAIFVNSNVFSYIEKGNFSTLDWILSPIFLVVGFVAAFLLVKLNRKN